jgi:two-component system NtrC family response regulator
MARLARTMEKLGPSDATVLLLGESGTGKELLARALHDLSNRTSGKFIALNCAAIPENLLESELFGYEKGAFTGAAKQTRGKIEYAHQGTLFLDEVGDLPSALQAKLLRFLQERVVERIGGREEISVDVRIVCATHQILKEMIKQNRFREDLYYRLSEIVIEIPPLRDRDGDAVLLANAFLARFTQQHGKQPMHFSEEAAQAIEGHPWPGNVRELENAVKRAVIMAEGTRITPEDLGLGNAESKVEPLNLRQVREEAERRAIVRSLARSDGNLAKAAELLGVSRPTLYDLLNRYGLKAGR